MAEQPQLSNPPGDPQPSPSASPGVTGVRRAVIIGLVLVGLLAWATPYNDYLIGATLIAGNYLPIGGFFVLTIIVIFGNWLLRTLNPRWALKPAELVVIWCMIATASSIGGSGLMRFLIPHSVAPLHYATPENGWEDEVISHLPNALIIRDMQGVERFFKGAQDGAVPWRLWVSPLLMYGLFAIALYLSFFCLSSLLRRQWVDRERFAFPLVALPVEMVQQPAPGHKLASVWYSAWLWVPVALLTLIHTNNGLRQFYPALPRINLYDHPITIFQDRPFNVLNGLRYPVYPLVVGVGYFLKSETLLSLWVFFMVFQAERVIAASFGLNPAQTHVGYGWPAFGSQQGAGMAIGLVLWILRNSRGYIGDLIAGRTSEEDAKEAIPPRLALWGWVIAMGFMFGWLWYFGGSAATAFLTMAFGTTAFIVLAWMVAQGGVLFLQTPWSGAEMGANLFGFRSFTARNILVSNQIESIFMLDLREFMLPHLFNTLKFSDQVAVKRRSIFIAVALAVGLSLIITGEESIRLPYLHGAEMMYDKWAYVHSPQRPLKFLESQLNSPLESNPVAWANIGAGLGAFWGLMFMYTRFVGFQLHPAAFIFVSGYPMQCFWFSYLLAWILKSLIMRYGGQKLYHRLRHVAYGLILGDALNGAAWIIIALITRKTYSVLPG